MCPLRSRDSRESDVIFLTRRGEFVCCCPCCFGPWVISKSLFVVDSSHPLCYVQATSSQFEMPVHACIFSLVLPLPLLLFHTPASCSGIHFDVSRLGHPRLKGGQRLGIAQLADEGQVGELGAPLRCEERTGERGRREGADEKMRGGEAGAQS
jgi:hypothetical protein